MPNYDAMRKEIAGLPRETPGKWIMPGILAIIEKMDKSGIDWGAIPDTEETRCMCETVKAKEEIKCKSKN